MIEDGKKLKTFELQVFEDRNGALRIAVRLPGKLNYCSKTVGIARHETIAALYRLIATAIRLDTNDEDKGHALASEIFGRHDPYAE